MIQKGTKLILAAYVIVAVTLWALDYFELDIEPLIGWLGLPADFLGATGIASGVGLTTYQVIRTAQLGLQTTSQQAVKSVNETALGLVTKITELNANNAQTQKQLQKATTLLESIIEFEKLLAEKNKQSRLLNEDSKKQLDTWIRKTEVIVRELKNENL